MRVRMRECLVETRESVRTCLLRQHESETGPTGIRHNPGGSASLLVPGGDDDHHLAEVAAVVPVA